MADTVITTPTAARDDSAANAMGWAIAIVLLLGIILFGLFVWPGLARISPATNQSPGIDVNVKLPQGTNLPGTNSGQGGGTQQAPAPSGGSQTP